MTEKKTKKPVKDAKDTGGKYNNTIEINPIIKEAAGKKIVIAWGRMNPPTIGHEKLVNKVKDIAQKTGAKAEIYLSHSQDAKKNPLSYDDKVDLAKMAFGPVITKLASKTIIDVMKALTGKYSDVTLVVGQDRVNEFETLLNKYNGKEFNFGSIEVVSAGERDPDSDGVEGMSASKMRAAASTGEKSKFVSGLPAKLKSHADDVWDLVRSGMKLAEEIEALGLNEHVLSYAERRQRAITMRRYERKMQAARERMKKRVADSQHLQTRARKKAIEILRRKFAGQKGLDYANLPVADKIMIDKQVEKRKKAITKIAARLLPSVRRAELQRVAGVMAAKPAGVNESFESFLEENANYYKGLSPSTVAKRKAHFNKHKEMDDDNPAAYKKAPGDATAKTQQSVHTKRYHMMYNGDGTLKYDRRFRAFRHIVRQEEVEIESDADLLGLIEEAWDLAVETNDEMNEEKAMEGLKKKAEKSGISYGTLKKVYDRGVAAWRTGHRPGTTPQQWGYARVNSFITGGKTRTTGDADLAKKLNETFEHKFAVPQIPVPDSIKNNPALMKRYLERHQKGAFARSERMKKNHAIFHEEGGAGDEGTGKVTKRYKKDTPAQSVNEAFEDMMELAKPSEIRAFRDKVKHIDKVDSRSKSWSDSLPAALGKYGFKLLGSGKYASVFGHPKYPFALKVFMKDSAYLRWIKFAMDNPNNPYVPKMKGKVIKITPVIYAMRLEKLTGGSFSGPFADAYRQWNWDRSYKSDDKNIQDILDFFGPNKDLLDLHGENVMMRGDQLVIIDPFYNWFGKKNPGAYTIDPDDIDPAVFGIKEEIDLVEESDEITVAKMKDFEKFVDRMFEKFKIDFDFTKHFGERMNDERNSPKIKLKELADLIKKIYAKNGNPLKGQAGAELVVKDIQSDLNMPVVIKYDEKNDEIDVVAKTIMRKKNFSTPNPVIKY